MRTRLAASASAVLLAIVAVLAGGCGGPSAADPYDLVVAASKAPAGPLQINVGFSATVEGTTIRVEPAAMAVVVDGAGGRFAIHVSLPTTGLGIPASALLQLGVSGDTIDFDMVYAGDAMYARSPVFKPMLSLILGPSGKVPAGDLTGWLKLGTKEELAAFAALSGGATATPSAPASSVTPQSLRTALDAAGITLMSVVTEKHDGADAQHVKVAIDAAKLVANPNFAAGAGPQYAQAAAALRATTLSGDLWIAPTTNRLLEIDLHVASTSDATQTGDVTVLLDDPDGSVSLDAPPATVNVPITTLFRELMKLIGNGAES